VEILIGMLLAASLISSHVGAAETEKIRLAFSAFAYANPPSLKGKTLNEFIDDRFIRKLDEEGL
jgi:hypothetical protein